MGLKPDRVSCQKKKKILFSPIIQPKSLGCPAPSLVVVAMMMMMMIRLKETRREVVD
jgi:hypothetical protein